MCWLRFSVPLFATDYEVSEFGEIDSPREALLGTRRFSSRRFANANGSDKSSDSA
jgi:hypothetical protein